MKRLLLKTKQLKVSISGMQLFILTPLMIFAFAGCNAPSNPQSNNSLKSDSTVAADSNIMADSAKALSVSRVNNTWINNWNYTDDTDKMTDKIIHTAINVSTSQLNLSAPYDGDNSAYIKLRKRDGENDVIIQIDKGQFISGVYGTTIRVRFDKNKAEDYDCSSSSDDDPTILFVNSASRFITRLKKSKKIIIEATLYQDGNQQMEFNTDRLNWNH